jgi:uncharacterized coiled-coil DUF342 family protein
MTNDQIDDMTVDSAIKIIKELRNQLEDWKESFANLAKERDGLWEDLERVTKERDEVRREVCMHKAALFKEAGVPRSSYDVASEREWDCFKQEDGK